MNKKLEHKSKLYKYVSDCKFLHHLDSFLNAQVLLERYDELNDPMEGFFRYIAGTHSDPVINEIVGSKMKYRISCFSCDYKNFLLWSYYANGHKGVCLEYEVDHGNLPPACSLSPVKYGTLPRFDAAKPADEQARAFLLTKAKVWEHEREVRLLCEDARQEVVEFGAITGVIFGVNHGTEDASQRRIRINNPSVRFYRAEMTFNPKSDIRRRRCR